MIKGKERADRSEKRTTRDYDPREAERIWWESGKTTEDEKGTHPSRRYFAHSVVRSRIYDTLLLLGCHDDSSVLDLGCGAGGDAIFISRASRKIIGVDLYHTALKQFSKKHFEGLRADVQGLLFPVDSFDFVICSGLLHHLVGQGDLRTYLKEFVRVSRQLRRQLIGYIKMNRFVRNRA